MTSKRSEFDPRYDQAYQRGGSDGGFRDIIDEAPQVVEISDAPQHQPGAAPQVWADLELRQRRYRTLIWAMAGGLVALGLFGFFADLIFPPEPSYLQPNSYGYMTEPWSQRLRYAAPNLINLGVLTAVVQLVLEQMQVFKLRTGR
ncbi:hypothetical protein H9638_00910 [Arthrobacter sp. Sa2BUA2]|uniref:Uncharacterized protein n=1 Tax=Arthrobacter pullicola TaxID=2762224 RepID=A0ABR8YDR9_9MICC|nr:hypothetical protein [Arthrobacter pullicola]MBD8042363.1 hypothetical protein [Arthrobacter pullicola]